MKTYQQFYLAFGIRKINQLITPPLPNIDRLALPKQSVVHFAPFNPKIDGPTEDYVLFNKNERPIRVKHVFELAEKEGRPRRKMIQTAELQRTFRSGKPRFRNFVDLTQSLRDPYSINVINYGYVDRLYEYPKIKISLWHKLHNEFATILYEIKELQGKGFNQFIELELPKSIPKISILKLAERNFNPSIFKLFSDPKLFIILQLWKWLGPNSSESMITRILPNGFKDLNLIINESGRFTVINLGVLYSWRRASKIELRLNENANRKGIDAEVAQKRFIRLLLSILELRTNDVPENLGDETEYVESKTNGNSISDVDADDFDDGDETSISNQFKDIDDEDEKEVEFFQEAIDKDLDLLEDYGVTLDNSDLTEDLEKEEETEEVKLLNQDAIDSIVIQDIPGEPKDAYLIRISEAADKGDISANEYKKALEYIQMDKMPVIDGKSFTDYIRITEEDTKIVPEKLPVDESVIVDKSMLKASLNNFDKQYVDKVMQKDIAAMFYNLLGAGVQVTNYHVEKVENLSDSYYDYQVQVKPLGGLAKTIRFKVPVINDEGIWKVGGCKYSTRKQKRDMPIRKISPSKVALTSYYNKIFVLRSDKRVNNRTKWINDKIYNLGIDVSNKIITEMVAGNNFDHENEYPKIYSTLAQGFRKFNLSHANDTYRCYLCPKNPESIFGDSYKEWNKDGNVILGITDTGKLLVVDKDSNLFTITNGVRDDGTFLFEEMIGLDIVKSPVEFSVCNVMGEEIPVGVILGYLLGFNGVCKLLNVKPRVVPAGKRMNLTKDEWAMAFEDQSLVFNRKDTLASLVLSGFRNYHKTLSQFSFNEFNSPDVYLNMLEESKLTARYLREINLMDQLYVDPITRELLRNMGEPETFRGLLLRASELLISDTHPQEQDASHMRIAGYERFSGMLYNELVSAMRVYKGKLNPSKFGLDVNPYAVWLAIQEDTAKEQVSDINPIQDLKTQEALTYSGTGGRTSRTIVAKNRIYHKTDMGVTSESTVDSSDVAINTFMSANPKLNSVRGVSDRFNLDEDGITSLMSTSSLVSPGSLRDDPKRVNFIGIQNRHVVGCESYHQPIIRTGYEYVIPYRVGKLFAYMAKKPGKVISLDKKGIIVEYDDGERVGVEIGRIFSDASGITLPHTVKTDMVINQSFNKGDCIAYNTNFFERDFLNPNRVIWKSSLLVNTVLFESPDTLEDGSSISKKLANKLSTKMTKIKDVKINFDNNVYKVLKEGDVVDVDSTLCLIENIVSSSAGMIDEDSADILKELESQSPKAKVKGIVEKVVVYYNGELEDMTETLKKLVMESNKRLNDDNESINGKSENKLTGNTVGLENFKVGSNPLYPDTACIRFYITSDVSAGIGDKGVFSNQLKTVFGNVFDTVTTEDGEEIDAIFGQKSEADRIVNSAAIMGTTNTLEEVISKKIVAVYES